MKLSTLIELIGSGWILLVAGVSMVGFGMAYGLNEALHLPLWAGFIGLGLFMGIVGYAFLDRGNNEAEKQVKELPFFVNALRSPWFTLGASIVGGVLLQRLTRVRREVVVEKTSVAAPPVEANSESKSGDPALAGTGVSHYLGEQLKTLGSLAGGAALSLGMDALGIPSVEQLINELLGNDKGEQNQDSNGSPRSSDNVAQTEHRLSAQSVPSHNGAHSPEEYDPIP